MQLQDLAFTKVVYNKSPFFKRLLLWPFPKFQFIIQTADSMVIVRYALAFRGVYTYDTAIFEVSKVGSVNTKGNGEIQLLNGKWGNS